MTDLSTAPETGKNRDGGFGMISLYVGIGAFAVAMAFGFYANSARDQAEKEMAAMRAETAKATLELEQLAAERTTLSNALAEAVTRKQTLEKQLDVANSWYGNLLDSNQKLTGIAFSTRLALEEQLTNLGRLPEQIRRREDVRAVEKALSSLAVRLDSSFAGKGGAETMEPAAAPSIEKTPQAEVVVPRAENLPDEQEHPPAAPEAAAAPETVPTAAQVGEPVAPAAASPAGEESSEPQSQAAPAVEGQTSGH